MSTFADILANVPPTVSIDMDKPMSRLREQIRRGVTHIPVIVIDEVAKYFLEVIGVGEEPKEADFPNVAPPFPEFWVEYRVPKTIPFGQPQQPTRVDFGGQRVGFFWYAEDRADGSPGWCLTSLMFVEHEGWAVGPLFSVRLDADAEGQLVEVSGTSLASRDPSVTEHQHDGIESWMFTLHYPAALAICFMHCSNVPTLDHEPKESHSRRYQKLYGRAPIVYKTLNIRSMQAIIRSKGGSNCGFKQALHIMRGHFKRFDQKPLFGKHKGLWWWTSHLRGSLEHGYVKKTYQVHPARKD